MLPLIFAGAAAVAGFTAAWQIQGMRYEQQLSDLRADQATALAKANADALAKTLSLQKAKDEAERLAKVRQSALARDLAANRDGLVRLHAAADTALRRAGDSHAACIADANALTVVFGKCAAELSDVAADADQLASDRQTLIDSWPK